MTVIPPRVERGQTVGIVAPAGPVKPERLRRGLERFGDAFRLRIAPSVTAPHPDGVPSYLAASDEVRAAELAEMLRDPDVRAIVLARGGYGIARILPLLDPQLLVRDPKPIVGFSDGTALLSWAYAAGVRGIHGPMIAQLPDLGAGDTARLIEMLTDPTPAGVRPWQLAMHGAGTARGHLVAANLTIAAMLVGTRWPLPLAGAIAIIEDVGERPYELDRYATHLAQTGALADTAAVIVADLARCVDPNPPTGVPDPEGAALATMVERITAAGVRSATGAPIGHGDRNEPIAFGARAVLDLDAGVLEILDGAVA